MNIKYLSLSLFTLLYSSLALAQVRELCDWGAWQVAGRASVESAIQAGDDPTQLCPNDGPNGTKNYYPIDYAAMFANDVGAVQALVDAGASILTLNPQRDISLLLFMGRYDYYIESLDPGEGIAPWMQALIDFFNNQADIEMAQQVF